MKQCAFRIEKGACGCTRRVCANRTCYERLKGDVFHRWGLSLKKKAKKNEGYNIDYKNCKVKPPNSGLFTASYFAPTERENPQKYLFTSSFRRWCSDINFGFVIVQLVTLV